MRIPLTVCLVLLILGGCQLSATLPSADDGAGLVVDIHPRHYRYCTDDSRGGTLQMQADVVFDNRGSHSLILYSGSGIVLDMAAAKTIADLKAGRLESHGYLFNISNEPLGASPLHAVREPSILDFVILGPGEFYGIRKTLAIPYVREAGHPGVLQAGTYYVQFSLETWPESADVGKSLHKKWENWGDLWFKPALFSEPLRIDIQPDGKAVHCD